ncbi:DNA polymerase IV [Fulvivirga sediminis]|uniref:DNA polymerase IV n=1 Tax=Fulvivirga sediminis TaxID=2803949 RepID=A0A937F969_9BACT|nr:DNA polymerase IV [Fulvivirga sediminis]MBL3657322.1 DNA polymerase IV [Fulvivirga sediminis]
MRKIIHIDMDAFYASVEQRDNPELKGKAVAVGGSSRRGVVAAASYEARKFGVRSAMPSKLAAVKCPNIIFIKPRFEAYKEVSQQIRNIFYDYTDLVEPLSLDEAYLDVTTNKKDMPSATLIAQEIRKRILEETQLTASAGISINKFLAKTASDVNKPNGFFLITPDDAEKFVETLPIARFFGIGKVTADKMKRMGIQNGADLKKYTEADLVSRFGKAGRYYYRIARGIDEREVTPNRIRKSLGAENTFEDDLTSVPELKEQLKKITEILIGRMEKSDTKGKTLTLKVKFHDFQQITRSKTITKWIENEDQITSLYEELLGTFDTGDVKIRLLGLSVSNLNHELKEEPIGQQLTLDF